VSTPHGPILASGADDGTLGFADPVAGAQISELDLAHADGVGALTEVTTADGVLLASGGADGRVCLWDPVERILVGSAPLGMKVTGLVYDQGQLFVGSRSGLVCLDVARMMSA
jgi:WD40 repeat protein